MPEIWQTAGFGLYVHWPFCQSKCPYCDFNSHVVASVDQTRWLNAYVSEIARAGAELPGRVLSSVYFGGGTPSLMRPDLVAAILEAAGRVWTLANDCEVTLEANPSSVEAGRFRGYRDAGVGRVSLGVQALSDPDLRALGRLHSVAEAMTALKTACDCFDRVSFDLIYARQNQSLQDWTAELGRAVALNTEHLSLYQLTVEDATAFGDRFRRGLLRGLPDEDLGADMYLATQDICGTAGLIGYETSNHARPGAESRHNLVYWRGGDYLGIGPGAHGRLTLGGTRFATETPLSPTHWLSQVEDSGRGESLRQEIDLIAQAQEYLMMALRLHEGADLSRFPTILRSEDFLRNIRMLCDDGFVELTGDSIKLTASGRPVLNAVLRTLLAGI